MDLAPGLVGWDAVLQMIPGTCSQLDDAVQLFGLAIDPELIVRDYVRQHPDSFTTQQVEWIVEQTFHRWDLRVAVQNAEEPHSWMGTLS